MRLRRTLRNLKLQKKLLLANIVFTALPCLLVMALLIRATDCDRDRPANQYLLLLAVGAVYLLLSIAMSVLGSRYLTRPLEKLRGDIEKICGGDLSVRSQIEAEDELGELAVRFNGMMGRIQELIRQLEERDEEKRALELQALQAQINPHFLYNTLASIRFLVELDQKERASRSLCALARLLKGTFSEHRQLIPLREEMESLESYLTLMENRYEDSFTWKLELDPSARELLVPRVFLQPLAENAIAHGLDMGGRSGEIQVIARREGEFLAVQVSDSGTGGDVDRIRESLAGASPVGGKERVCGIGIRNVRERLRLIFGEDCGIEACQKQDGGLCFSMRLPAWESRKETADGSGRQKPGGAKPEDEAGMGEAAQERGNPGCGL